MAGKKKSSEANHTSPYALSVILVTPGSYKSIRCTVQALRRQTVKDQLELIIVGPSKEELAVVEEDLGCFAGYQVKETGQFVSSAAARAQGVHVARAPVVAFVEDHAFPAEGWAEAFISKHQESWSGVGPVFCNANPATAASWASFVMEHGEWADPPLSPDSPRSISGSNSSYKRAALLEYGPHLAGRLESETTMQWDMMKRGHTFCPAPGAKVYHLNYSLIRKTVGLRFQSGRLFAAHRAKNWGVSRRALYALGSPLIPLLRLTRALSSLDRIGQKKRIPAVLFPLAVFLGISGFGEMVGYLFGFGGRTGKSVLYEFHRKRYLTEKERRMTESLEELFSKGEVI